MKKINIIIGRFQPFTKGHLKCIEEVYKKLSIPTIIVMIDTPSHKVNLKHPFETSFLLPIYKDLFSNNKMIEDIVLAKNANIVDIGEMLYGMGYEIRSWVCGTDRLQSYTKMSTRYKQEARLSDDFEMVEIKRSDDDISATKVRKSLLDNDRNTFNKLMPTISLKSKLKHDLFTEMRNRLMKLYEGDN